jgi:hypothetical protein
VCVCVRFAHNNTLGYEFASLSLKNYEELWLMYEDERELMYEDAKEAPQTSLT